MHLFTSLHVFVYTFCLLYVNIEKIVTLVVEHTSLFNKRIGLIVNFRISKYVCAFFHCTPTDAVSSKYHGDFEILHAVSSSTQQQQQRKFTKIIYLFCHSDFSINYHSTSLR